MPQLGVLPFHRVGLTLVGQRRVLARVVDEILLGGRLVRVILLGRRRHVEQRLQALWLPVVGHVIGDDAAAGALYLSDEIDPLFLSPSNV